MDARGEGRGVFETARSRWLEGGPEGWGRTGTPSCSCARSRSRSSTRTREMVSPRYPVAWRGSAREWRAYSAQMAVRLNSGKVLKREGVGEGSCGITIPAAPIIQYNHPQTSGAAAHTLCQCIAAGEPTVGTSRPYRGAWALGLARRTWI
jgi:hypothetical protein